MSDNVCATTYFDGKRLQDCSLALGHEKDHGRRRGKWLMLFEAGYLVSLTTLPLWLPYTMGMDAAWLLLAILIATGFLLAAVMTVTDK